MSTQAIPNTAALFHQRRRLIQFASAASLGALPSSGQTQNLTGKQTIQALGGKYPFALGVASGAPRPHSVVLWTRLATKIRASEGERVTHHEIPNSNIQIDWEIAEDEAFSRVSARGVALASPTLGHSVHIEPNGLKSATLSR